MYTSMGLARQVPALLPRLQLAFLPLWLVCIKAALIFTLVTVATVTFLTLLHHPISTYRLARFWSNRTRWAQYIHINFLQNLQTQGWRDGLTVYLWRLAALPEGLLAVSSIHMALTTVYNLRFRGSDTIFWTPRESSSHMMQTYMQAKHHKHKK